MSAVVEVDGLMKRYGDKVVVDGISFTVEAGEIFGVVGPNGAGKTTTIECVEGLKRADGGRVRTLGLDPSTDTRTLQEQIGVQLQETSLPLRMKVREAVELFASFYAQSVAIDPLLDRLGIAHKQASSFSSLSGGERQRLFIALALVHDPKVVFLDELTTGLDPHARRSMWELVESIRERGGTVVLTTHFMEEAERLCDRVAILEGGRIVALDSPAELIRSVERPRRVVLNVGGSVETADLLRLPGVISAEVVNEQLTVEGSGEELTHNLLRQLISDDIEIRDLRTEGGNLEDAYLQLTGRQSTEASE